MLGYGAYDDVLKSEAAQSLQRSVAALSSLVFVGFGSGLEDPNFAALLEWMARVFSGREAHHFRLVRDAELAGAPSTLAKQRVATLAYGAAHSDLPGYLRRLAAEAGLSVGPPDPR